MGCVSAAGVRIAHEFTITVISGDKQNTPNILCRLGKLANTRIDDFNGFNCGRQKARMADHVGVGIVQYDQVIFTRSDRIQGFMRKLRSRHLRLKVVGCNLGRRDHDTVLARIGIFPATIKEVGDVRIFLRLSHTQLREACRSHHFPQNVQ